LNTTRKFTNIWTCTKINILDRMIIGFTYILMQSVPIT